MNKGSDLVVSFWTVEADSLAFPWHLSGDGVTCMLFESLFFVDQLVELFDQYFFQEVNLMILEKDHCIDLGGFECLWEFVVAVQQNVVCWDLSKMISATDFLLSILHSLLAPIS